MKIGSKLNIKDHEVERTKERDTHLQYDTEAGYRSMCDRLTSIWQAEGLRDKQARKRTGVTQPARLYSREQKAIDQLFAEAMQRLWDIGTIDNSGRANLELRRTYHLIAKGRGPLTETDVIKLARKSEEQLRLLLLWLAHRLSATEAQDHVDLGEVAPPIIEEHNGY